MILVRHGLMVVGLPFSGKTSIIHVLAEALEILFKKGKMNE
jgi:dynein heavy chain